MRTMRSSIATFLVISLSIIDTVLATSNGYSPFANTLQFLGRSNEEAAAAPAAVVEASLDKRQIQGNCRSGYTSCSPQGAPAACCPNGTNCALDQAGNIACCPVNAVCTGTIDASITATGTSTSGFVLGATTTTQGQATTSFQVPQLPTTGVAGGGSTVANAFYPFVYIPTSYANAQLCSSAYTNCQAQSTACLSSLAGVNGVTVGGLGGGVTVQGASGTILSSASSICSSLSQSACYGLQQSVCNNFGGASGSFVQSDNKGPRETGCAGLVQKAGAVAGMVGVMGVLF